MCINNNNNNITAVCTLYTKVPNISRLSKGNTYFWSNWKISCKIIDLNKCFVYR